jgi:hypothetical protein
MGTTITSSNFSRSLKDKLSLPPDNITIKMLPIFYPLTIEEEISSCDLHPDFRPFIALSDIAFSARTKNILESMGLKIIGEVMCTSQNIFLKQKNCGWKSLHEIHKTIKQIVFENFLEDSFGNDFSINDDLATVSAIDYTSYETMVENFVKIAIKKDRQQKIIFARLCFHSSTIPTLEELGEKHNISREGARQVIKKATDVLKIKSNFIKLARFWNMSENFIRGGGGVIHLDALAKALKEGFNWPRTPNPLAIGQLLSLWLPNQKLNENSAVIEIDCECLFCDRPLKTIRSIDFESDESFHVKVVERKLFDDCQKYCVNRSVPVLTFHDAFLERVVSSSDERFIIKDGLLYTYDKRVVKHGNRLENDIKKVLLKHERPMYYKALNDYFSAIGSSLETEDTKRMRDPKPFDSISDSVSTDELNNESFNNSATGISIKKARRVKIKL